MYIFIFHKSHTAVVHIPSENSGDDDDVHICSSGIIENKIHKSPSEIVRQLQANTFAAGTVNFIQVLFNNDQLHQTNVILVYGMYVSMTEGAGVLKLTMNLTNHSLAYEWELLFPHISLFGLSTDIGLSYTISKVALD